MLDKTKVSKKNLKVMSFRRLGWSFFLNDLTIGFLGRFQNNIACRTCQCPQRAFHILFYVLCKIGFGRRALRQNLVMEILDIKFDLKFSLGVFSQLHQSLLTQHVRSGLAGNTLVTSDFFSSQIGVIPSIMREIP